MVKLSGWVAAGVVRGNSPISVRQCMCFKFTTIMDLITYIIRKIVFYLIHEVKNVWVFMGLDGSFNENVSRTQFLLSKTLTVRKQ